MRNFTGLVCMALAITASVITASVALADPATKEKREGADRNTAGANTTASAADHDFAHWLMGGNKAEIELGNLADEKSQTPAVKEFAQMMVKDHTAYLNELKRFAGDKNDKAAEGRSAEQSADQSTETKGHASHQQLMQVGQRACEINLQMTKDMLSKHSGHDFDMGYLGQQMGAHMNMLATLSAMKGQGSPEFQKVVNKGIETTQQHLQHAMNLGHQLKDRNETQATTDQPRTGETRRALRPITPAPGGNSGEPRTDEPSSDRPTPGPATPEQVPQGR